VKINHTVNWNWIATVLAIITIVLGLQLNYNENTNQELSTIIKRQQIDIKYKDEQIQNLKSVDNLQLYGTINEITQYYENMIARNKNSHNEQLSLIIDSLKSKDSRRGLSTDSLNLALSYGAQCFDNLELVKKQLKNQTKITNLYKDIANNKDSIITVYKSSIQSHSTENNTQLNKVIIYFILGLSIFALIISGRKLIQKKFKTLLKAIRE